MSWFSIIGSFLGIIQAVVSYLHDRKLIDQGVAQEVLKSNQDTLNAIDKANKARNQVIADANSDPSNIVRSDEFKRPD